MDKEIDIARPYGIPDVFKNIISRVSIDLGAIFCSEIVGSILYRSQYLLSSSYNGKAPRPGDILKMLDFENKKYEVRKIIQYLPNEAQHA